MVKRAGSAQPAHRHLIVLSFHKQDVPSSDRQEFHLSASLLMQFSRFLVEYWRNYVHMNWFFQKVSMWILEVSTPIYTNNFSQSQRTRNSQQQANIGARIREQDIRKNSSLLHLCGCFHGVCYCPRPCLFCCGALWIILQASSSEDDSGFGSGLRGEQKLGDHLNALDGPVPVTEPSLGRGEDGEESRVSAASTQASHSFIIP